MIIHTAPSARLCAVFSCFLGVACSGDDNDDAPADDTTDSGDGDGDSGDGDAGDGDGDGDGDDDPGDGDGDGDAGDGDGDAGDGDGDGDEKPNLGDTPNVLCEAALASLDMIVAENQSGTPDAMTIEAAYVDTGLQEFVQLSGAVTGRIEDGVLIDDAAILAAIADGSPLAMIDVEWTIYLAMQQYIRHEVTDVSATLPNPANDPALLYGRWDASWCYWNGALRPLAQLADGVGLAGDTIEADIDEGFQWGHDGIEGAEPWAVDPWAVPPAKQVVEKSMYTMVHRLVMQWSADAAAEADPDIAASLARAAYGAFQIIQDRINTKNTPGIAIIETALLGDPANIDPDDVLLQMNIALAKRTQRYTNLALPDNAGTMGTPEGHWGAVEGSTYSKSIEPFMAELDGFDPAAYRATWTAWITAITDDDLPAGEAASAELLDWNCQYQAAIGITECTWDIDEQ